MSEFENVTLKYDELPECMTEEFRNEIVKRWNDRESLKNQIKCANDELESLQEEKRMNEESEERLIAENQQLRSRIEELEKQNEKLNTPESYSVDDGDNWSDDLFSDLEYQADSVCYVHGDGYKPLIFEVRCVRETPMKWALLKPEKSLDGWDDYDLFDTKEEAEAALKEMEAENE